MMNRSESELSQHVQRSSGSETSIVSVPAGTPIRRTQEDLERLRRLAEMPDSEINFSDIPKLTPEEYEEAKHIVAAQRTARLKKAS